MTERSNLPSTTDLLLSFGKPVDPPTMDSPVVAAKKSHVQQTALQKMANYGTPAEQRAIVTAMANDNRLAQDPGLQDLDLDPLSYIQKYGREAFEKRGRWTEAYRELMRLKNAERGAGETALDTAIDVGVGAMNTLGGAAVLGANFSDQVIRGAANVVGLDAPTALSPYLSMGLGWAGEQLQGQQSDLMQARREQLALENELDRADNEAAYQEALTANTGSDSTWDRAISPWLQKQGRAISDTAENYWDDPMMLGSLGAEGAGSLLPVTAASKLASMGGMAAERAAMLAIGATEGGAAISQTQQRIMNASPEELPLSEEERLDVARDAGSVAGLTALPGALLAGKIAAPFAASPLASSLNPVNAARNIGRETVEEGIQEGNTQVASNQALDQVAGIETPLDEGVAEAATMGMMGGAMTAGALQAPGAAAALTAEAAKAATKGVGAVIKARADQVEASIDNESTVGTQAREEAANNIAAVGQEMLDALEQNVPNPTPPEDEEAKAAVESVEGDTPVTEEVDDEPQTLGARIQKGLFLDEDEAVGYSERYDRLKKMREENPEAPISRAHAVLAAEDALMNPQVSPVDKFDSALGAIRTFNDMVMAAGTDVAREVEALPEEDPQRKRFEVLKQNIAVLESSPALAAARDLVKGLTREKVAELVPMELLKTGTEEEKLAVGQMLETIALVNPEAVTEEVLDDVLEQIGGIGTPGRKMLEDRLELMRSIAQKFTQADRARVKIQQDYDAVIEGMENKPAKPYKTWDVVRNETDTIGNTDNGLPSLSAHRDRILSALRTRRLDTAQAALKDLKNFAQHLINKVGAYNQSANTTKGKRTPFEAYGPFGWFEDKKGVYANVRSPKSVAMIQEAVVDAEAAVNLHNMLSRSLSLALKEGPGETLKVPDLHADLSPLAQSVKAAVATPTAPVAGTTGGKAVRPKRPRGLRPRRLKEFVISAGGIWKNDPDAKGAFDYKRPGFLKNDRFRRSTAGDNRGGRTLDELREIAAEAGYLPMESTVADFLDLLQKDLSGDAIHSLEDQSAAMDWADYDADMDEFRKTRPAKDGSLADRVKGTAAKAGKAAEGMGTKPAPQAPAPKPPADLVPEETPPEDNQDLDQDTNEEEYTEAEEDLPEEAVEAARSWFEGLKDRLYKAADGLNHFLNSFRPSRRGSLLHTVTDPAAFMLENISNLARPGVNGMVRELSDKEQAGLQALLTDEEHGLPGFKTLLEQAIQIRMDKAPKKGGLTWLDRMLDGQEIQGWDNALILNYLTEREDGGFEVEPKVAAATFMAAAEWVIQSLNGPRPMGDEEISKLFGQKRGDHVTDRMKALARFGTSHQTVVEEIAGKIGALLGVDPKSDVTISRTQGMLKSLAANVLEIMLENGTIEVNGPNGEAWDKNARTVDKKTGEKKPVPIGSIVEAIDGETRKKEPITMVMIRPSAGSKDPESIFSALKTMRDPFTRTFTKAMEKDRYIGEAPKQIQETQIGNDFARISDLGRKVIQRLNKRPTYVNEPLLALVDALGDDAYKALLGYVTIKPGDEKRYSKADLESIQGKNQSLDRGLEETRGYVEEARLYGAAKGQALGEVKIFHSHALSSVGRLQQQGPVTPQNDKTARELISTTFSTIELANDEHMEAFWLAVAQSIGMKVEKEPHLPEEGGPQGVFLDVQEVFLDEAGFLPAVNNLREFLRTGVLEHEKLLNTIWSAVDAKGKTFEPSAKLIHALLTVAQLEEAKAKGETTLRTALALEADGRTDGPGNAMIHMGTGLYRRGGKLEDGGFTPDEIKRFAKVGLFFTDEPLSLNEYIAAEWRKNPAMQRGEDLYHMAAKRFEQILNARVENGADGNTHAVLHFLDAFHKDFKIAKDIERGLVKNPLTVFLYGSGVKGIAGKIVGEAMTGFYKALSEAIAAKVDGKVEHVLDHGSMAPYAEFAQDFRNLTGVDLRTRLANKPEEFELKSEEFMRMVDLVQKHFADPMTEAIDETTGGLAASMKLTQTAASVQTVIFKDLLNQKMAARSEGLPNGELLSEKEMKEVFAEVMAVAPIYGTDGEDFHISAPKKAPEGREIAGSMNSRFLSKARELRGSDASVKVSPYMTIGTGDGRMILNIYVNGDGALEASLPVFDGVEQAIADVPRASEQINASVFEGWTGQNLYQSLSDGFWQMLAKLDEKTFETLSRGTLEEIAKTLDLRNSKGALVRPRLDHLRQLHQDLENRALISEARKLAILAMPTQTDHMAGARRPHGREGTVEWKGGPLDFEGIAETLNGIFRDELKRLTDKAIEAGRLMLERKSYAQPESQALKNAVAQIGEEVEGHKEVYRLRGEQLLPLISEATEASAEHVKLFWDILMKDPSFKEATYYFGDGKALEAVRDEFHGNLVKKPIQLGQAHQGAGVVFIANQAPETLLHEMLHTHTMGRLTAHYQNPEGSPAYIRDAVQRLQSLVQEVMKLNPEMAGDAAPALMTLQGEMRRLGREGRKAAVISELISYALTNQELISLTQRKKTYGPLMQVIHKGLKYFKDLLGIRSLPDNTLFSNIRFNTEVLLGNPVNGYEVVAQNVRTDELVDQTFGVNERLAGLERKFLHRLQEHLEASRPKDPGRLGMNERAFQHQVARLGIMSQNAAEIAIANHFDMDPRQAQAFRSIHSAMMSGMKLDTVLLRQVNEAYAHVSRTLSQEMLLKAENAGEPPTRDALERASKRLEFLTSTEGLRSTADGKTDLLATFVALAQVDDVLRAALKEMAPPKMVEVKWTSVDNALESIGTSAVNLLTRLSFKRARQPRSVQEQLDVLAAGLAEIESERRYLATLRLLTNPLDRLNDTIASGIKAGSEKATAALAKRSLGGTNKVSRLGFSVGALVTALGSKEASEKQGEALTTMLNHAKGFHEIRALLNDMRGATKSNIKLLRLVNQVRAHVDALRQDYREAIPDELAKRFSRKLHKDEWTALFYGVGRSDLLALGMEEGMELMKDPASVNRRIQEEEERLAAAAGSFAPRYKAKAKALSIYMIKRKVTSRNLLRNAHAIANLFGEQGTDGAKIRKLAGKKEVMDGISRLTTLYAFKQLDRADLDRLKHLAETQAGGIEALAGFHRSIRQAELERRTRSGEQNLVAFNNGWKGYVPSVSQEGASVIVRDDSAEADLLRRGYVRIGDYKGDRWEDYPGKRGYYQSTVAGQGAFRQGVAQTVHDTWQGVDARNGTTLHGETAGYIVGGLVGQAAISVARNPGRHDGLKEGEYLLPVFNDKGLIVAYERPMDPDKMVGMKRDTHLGRMMGAWMGRIVEEEAADEFNKELIQTLKQIWEDHEENREDEFINVADSKDPVIDDAWGTLGWKIKADAAKAFGKRAFLPIRKDMVNDAIGFRAAGIRDLWSGTSRWAPKHQKAARDFLTLVLGKKAYQRMVQAENTVQDVVSYAKTTIVVRSITMIVDNILSNMLQLSLYGIGPVEMATTGRKKFLEIQEFVKNQRELKALEIDLASAKRNHTERRKIEARMKALEEANARMSIVPLLEAGEFSTISESLTEADVAIREGRFSEFLEKATDKLPSWAGVVAKNALITKDTALFKGLNRMVQYGDFVAKAVLYDHLTKEKGMGKEEALDVLMEEFVQYNRLPGRGRDFLESMGLLWFFNYKLRITKIALKMWRENPLRALMLMGGAGPMAGVDSAWSGSLPGKALDGGLGFAFGPQMGLNAWTLNPWYNFSK